MGNNLSYNKSNILLTGRGVCLVDVQASFGVQSHAHDAQISDLSTDAVSG